MSLGIDTFGPPQIRVECTILEKINGTLVPLTNDILYSDIDPLFPSRASIMSLIDSTIEQHRTYAGFKNSLAKHKHGKINVESFKYLSTSTETICPYFYFKPETEIFPKAMLHLLYRVYDAEMICHFIPANPEL
jgi:hypothetical protein